MNNETRYASPSLRTAGLLALILLGIFGTLATGGGGGGGGGPTGGAGTIQLLATSFDAAEGTIVNIRVARSGGSSGTASVAYATADDSATAGGDYTAASGTLTWADGVSGNLTISIAITDDAAAEGIETFTVTLSNVSAGTLGLNSSATVSIIDNDVTSLSASGPITALASATMNGIRYNTDAASVVVNGAAAAVADLELGWVVSIDGEANLSEATGTADTISYSAMAVGPVENVDADLKQWVVMGQTVRANADTVLDPRIDPDTLAGLAVGAIAQVSGYRSADGDIIASRVGPDTGSTFAQLIGTVEGLDLANMLFSIGRLTVDYGSAVRIDLPGGAPADGLLVLVRGALIGGILLVDEIESVGNFMATPGRRVYVGGIVTQLAPTAGFDLNHFRITTGAQTRYVNGVAGDLLVDAEVTIDGEVVPAADSVLANTITFGRPVPDRTTRTFNFANFDRVSVSGLSSVTIAQGPDFSVEVTADSTIVDNLQVSQIGTTLSLGPPPGVNNAQMLVAIVEMPVLNRIDVVPGALANVTLVGFNQPQMTVTVGGVSRLRGESLTINNLTAAVAGVSMLDFGGIRPIGSATIDIDGVSQATLNMDVGAALSGTVTTGQGTGVSRLFYYGTNVALNVTKDSQSIVTQLGGTRP